MKILAACHLDPTAGHMHGREANSQKDHLALHLEWDSQRCERNGMLHYIMLPFVSYMLAVILMVMFINTTLYVLIILHAM